MNIFQKLAQLFTVRKEAPSGSDIATARAGWVGYDDEEVVKDPFLSAIFAKIQGAIEAVEFVAEGDRWEAYLRSPGWRSILSTALQRYLVRGNAVLYLDDKRILKVAPPTATLDREGVWVVDDMGRRIVPYDRCAHVRFPLPGPTFAPSPVEIARPLLDALAEAADGRLWRLASRGGANILTPPPGASMVASNEDINSAMSAIARALRMRSEFGRVTLFSEPLQKLELGGDGAADYNASTWELLRWLGALFGVPSILLNDTERGTYANYREAQREFLTNTVIPLAQKFANALSALTGDEVRIIHNFDALADAKLAMVDALAKAWWLTPDEKRRLMGYDELEGVPGDEPLVPANLRRLSDIDIDLMNPPSDADAAQ